MHIIYQSFRFKIACPMVAPRGKLLNYTKREYIGIYPRNRFTIMFIYYFLQVALHNVYEVSVMTSFWNFHINIWDETRFQKNISTCWRPASTYMYKKTNCETIFRAILFLILLMSQSLNPECDLISKISIKLHKITF